MTYTQLIDNFLQKIKQIKASNPAYKQPGDGTGGVCDCIGLVIGAIRKMGLKWTGIHGSNYAARYQIKDLKEIKSIQDLELGDVVLKAYDKGHEKWKLPDRYFVGHEYYNGDLKDYYHAGVVTSVDPFQITHMTSPRMKVDTKLDAMKNSVWRYHGKALPIVKAVDDSISEPEPSGPIIVPIPSKGTEAVVVSDNGMPVKIRQYPSTSCGTYDKLMVGTKVTILEPGETWAKINGGKRKGWYMMAKFLDVVGDGEGKY